MFIFPPEPKPGQTIESQNDASVQILLPLIPILVDLACTRTQSVLAVLSVVQLALNLGTEAQQRAADIVNVVVLGFTLILMVVDIFKSVFEWDSTIERGDIR